MIQNLRFVFSHQDIIILSGIFAVTLFLIFPIKKYNIAIAYRIIVACCLWWILLVFIYPPQGSNYNIYTYNASLTIYGQKTFDRIDIQSNNESKISFRDVKYLDYTGAQHLLYVILENIDLYKVNPNLSAFGFRLWTIINLSFILLLIFSLDNSTVNEIDASKIWPIIFIAFCPIIPFYLFITHWEDKLIFLLLPLLIIFLIQNKKYKTASFSIGFIITFNGLTIFFLPIYIIFLFREEKKNFLINLGIIIIGIIIALLPFFPESLSAWKSRLDRTNSYKPFWYSFYSFLPKGYYVPLLNNFLIILVSLATIIFFLLRKISLIDSLIISVSIVLLFSPFNVISRVIPLILLISILSPNMSRYNWLSLGFILYFFLLVDNGYIAPVVNTLNTFLFYIPIIYSFAIYLYKRITFGNNIILEINAHPKA